jgi:hypothetical protein
MTAGYDRGKKILIPVRYSSQKVELLYGGDLPRIQDNRPCELVIDIGSIADVVTCPPRMFPVLELGYGYSERGHHGKKALYS